MKFDILQDDNSIIKVIGVGGGGGNAINHMFRQGIKGVDFIICNTDAQALELSPIPNKIQLGPNLTEGRGAGSLPEVGRHAAIENIDQIKRLLANTKMVFITAGLGGGTGTGASPIIAQAAHELGILTVGIVTTPFSFEGKRRKLQAEDGLEELRKNVDTLLVVSNDKLREMFGNLTLTNAFAEADNILTTAAKGIAEIITVPGYINVDFEDVKTVMKNSGAAVMGSWTASGEDRAKKAVQGALSSPLLNDNEIEGARYILLNISSGKNEVLMDEVTIITDYIQEEAGLSADIIWGNCNDEDLNDELSVTIIATGFQTRKEKENTRIQNPERIIKVLNAEMEPMPGFSATKAEPLNKIKEITPSNSDSEYLIEKIQIKRQEEISANSTDTWNAKSREEFKEKKDTRLNEVILPREEIKRETGKANEPYIWNFEPFLKSNSQENDKEKEVQGPVNSETIQNPLFPPHITLSSLPLKLNFSENTVPEEPTRISENSQKSNESSAQEISLFSPRVHLKPKMEMKDPEKPGQKSGSSDSRDFPPLISPRQVTMDFEGTIKNEPLPQNTLRDSGNISTSDPNYEDPMKRTKDRILRLKELSLKLKSPKGLEDLENEPAYVRKNLKLDQVPHSSTQEELSRLTLSERDGITEIRSNNTFLHDNVD